MRYNILALLAPVVIFASIYMLITDKRCYDDGTPPQLRVLICN